MFKFVQLNSRIPALLCSFALAGCSHHTAVADIPSHEAHFHALYNAQQWQQIYGEADATYQRGMTQRQANILFTTLWKKSGPWTASTCNPKMQRVELADQSVDFMQQCKTLFAHGERFEQFTWHAENKTLRLAHYAIAPEAPAAQSNAQP
jgi:hypothetical protein